jgi:hypothetical protein
VPPQPPISVSRRDGRFRFRAVPPLLGRRRAEPGKAAGLAGGSARVAAPRPKAKSPPRAEIQPRGSLPCYTAGLPLSAKSNVRLWQNAAQFCHLEMGKPLMTQRSGRNSR